MPEVVAEQVVKAPVKRVFAIARQIERFPEWLDYVTSITVRERSEDGRVIVSEWEVFVPMLRLKARWVEQDEWDEGELVCRFSMTEGDFDRYEGIWTFEPHPEGTLMRLRVNYVYRPPVGGSLIQRLVRKIVEETVRKFLRGIKVAAERDAP